MRVRNQRCGLAAVTGPSSRSDPASPSRTRSTIGGISTATGQSVGSTRSTVEGVSAPAARVAWMANLHNVSGTKPT